MDVMYNMLAVYSFSSFTANDGWKFYFHSQVKFARGGPSVKIFELDSC